MQATQSVVRRETVLEVIPLTATVTSSAISLTTVAVTST